MFTGLIESVGIVSDVVPTSSGFTLTIRTPMGSELRQGESVAVNGVCLTATTCSDAGWTADIGPETARVTTLGALRAGAASESRTVDARRWPVRRTFRAGARRWRRSRRCRSARTGSRYWIAVRIPAELEPFVILKGSIAIDGVSLTVARLDRGLVHVMIIPFTWAHTTLSSLRAGDRVNLECDMVGKYVARSMELAARSGLTP